MKNLYEKNSLMFWDEKEILLKEFFEKMLTMELKECLMKMNSAFRFVKVDAPLFIPKELINENYTKDDVFLQNFDDLALRPESTKSSYVYAKHLLNVHNEIKYRLPLVVYQHNKSFRKEQDKTLSNMRLKEFYQIEYQIFFSKNTNNDYYPQILECCLNYVNRYVKDARLEKSDRLPSYSDETIDIILNDNNMELFSISRRKDFDEDIKVIEVSTGSDRLVYNKMR